MTNDPHETPDRKAAKVAEAARQYAKAASSPGRPLDSPQSQLLAAVSALIGKPVKTE